MAVGVLFARSLHYQFYCWYWHSLPWLLWRCEAVPAALKGVALILFEYAWSYGVDKDEGTPTVASALALQLAHLILLAAVALAPPTTAFECVATDYEAAATTAALVTVNGESASSVAALAARRGGVSPVDARGAVLVAADAERGALTVQLWEGDLVHVYEPSAPSKKDRGAAPTELDAHALLEWVRRMAAE